MNGKPLPVEDLIKCAKREVVMRRKVYPRRVTAGKMNEHDAKHEIACMEAIVELLENYKRPALFPQV